MTATAISMNEAAELGVKVDGCKRGLVRRLRQRRRLRRLARARRERTYCSPTTARATSPTCRSTRASVTTTLRGMNAAWGDFDGDGHLDVYVANYMQCTGDWETAGEVISQVAYYDDTLYHNNGDGTFSDVTDRLEHDPDSRDDGSHGRRRIRRGLVDYNGDDLPGSVSRQRLRRTIARPATVCGATTGRPLPGGPSPTCRSRLALRCS